MMETVTMNIICGLISNILFYILFDYRDRNGPPGGRLA